jgi:hypothetical protein
MAKTEFGPYVLMEQIGRGGMGTVYRALQSTLQRTVALKLMHPECAHQSEVRSRFIREMRLAMPLRHPNLCTVVDVGFVGETPYIAMELLEGKDLQSRLTGGHRLSWTQVVEIGKGVVAGLRFLHAQGIIHRDLKPANIFLTDAGIPKLLDLGVALGLESTRLTQGSAIGTPLYIAPELVTGGEFTTGCDVWSLGGVLYRAVTGHDAIHGSTPQDWVFRTLQQPIPPATHWVPDLPPRLSGMLATMLDRNPKTRATLQHVSQELMIAGTPDNSAGRIGTRRQLLSVMAVVVAGGIATISAGFFKGAPVEHSRSGSAPAPSPSPTPAPTAQNQVHQEMRELLMAWRSQLDMLPRLRAGGVMATDAVRTLHERVAFDFGRSPATWQQWIQLGMWLDGPKDKAVPRLPWAQKGTIDGWQEGIYVEAVRTYFFPAPTRQQSTFISHAITSLGMFPDDGRNWLLLGRIYDLAGLTQEARRLYEEAMVRPIKLQMAAFPAIFWSALARALLLVPEHDLEAEWLHWVAQEPDSSDAWLGLHDALELSDISQERRILAKAQANPRFAEQAVAALGRLESEFDADVARRVWSDGLKRWPRSSVLAERVVGWSVPRGYLEEVPKLLELLRGSEPLRRRLDYLRGTVRNWDLEATYRDQELMTCAVMRRVAAGELESASTYAAARIFDNEFDPRLRNLVALELMAAGLEDGPIVEHVRKTHPGPETSGSSGERRETFWFDAAASFAVSREPNRLDKLLQAAERASPHQADFFAFIRALWRSRAGKLAPAAAELDHALQLNPQCGVVRSPEYVELLCRPYWLKAAGATVEEALLVVDQRKLASSALWPTSTFDYLKALSRNDLVTAARLARNAVRAQPSSRFWFEADARAEALTGEGQARRDAFVRLRANARYYYRGVWGERFLADLETGVRVAR